MLNEAPPVWPELFVAVQLTVVVPTMNLEPDAGVHVGVSAPSFVSEAVAVNVSTLPDGSFEVSVMSAGTVTVGAESLTVTVNDAWDVLFDGSVAVQLIVVTP
jgi:hypothetical protein